MHLKNSYFYVILNCQNMVYFVNAFVRNKIFGCQHFERIFNDIVRRGVFVGEGSGWGEKEEGDRE
jgi:hypothetical protein